MSAADPHHFNPSGAAPLPPEGVPRTNPDFWDIGDSDYGGQQLAPDHEFSELVEVGAPATGGSPVLYALLGVIAVVGGWLAYEIFWMERDPVATLSGWTDTLVGAFREPEVAAPVIAPKVAKEPQAPSMPESPATPPQKTVTLVEGNPYWHLPNRILVPPEPIQRAWTPDEEESFRAGLAHRYPYQRFKTVMDVRKERLAGSDVILWDALQDRKFWTRMQAAIGLAEFGTEVSLSSLQSALSGARSELIANFLERLVQRPSSAQAFILRQLVRVMDERGRLVALRGIVRSKDVLRDLYIVAATRDSGAAIQKWVGDTLAQRPLSTARFNELLAIVDGKNDGSYLLAGIKAPATSLQPASVAGIATDVDLESELEEFEASEGEVVFYDIEDSLKDDQPKAAESDISEDKPASADAPASYEEPVSEPASEASEAPASSEDFVISEYEG